MSVLSSFLGTMNKLVDWFLPEESKRALSDTRVETSFIFLHLFGPLMGQVIGLFLFYADPNPGIEVLVIEAAICSFWILPFALKKWGNIKAVAYASTQMLTFISLYGAFHYGGMSSPFVPWLLIALLLGFFYLAGKEKLLMGSLAVQLVVLCWCGRHLRRLPDAGELRRYRRGQPDLGVFRDRLHVVDGDLLRAGRGR